MPHSEATNLSEKNLRWRYTLLTFSLALPLIGTFVAQRNVYPFGASTMMLGLKDSRATREYYILQGETMGGETIDLPPIQLTDALTGRNWSLVGAAIDNKSFAIRNPYPQNLRLVAASGGVSKLPKGARLDELLRAWGNIYNDRLPTPSDRRLKAVKLHVYRWEGGIGGDYSHFIESWRTLL